MEFPSTSLGNLGHRQTATLKSSGQQPLEVMLSNFVALLKRHKIVVIIPIVLAQAAALYTYFYGVSYKSTAKLLVQKADNSSLQALSIDLGASKSQLLSQNVLKDNYIETLLIYLNSRDYYEDAAKNLLETESGNQLFRSLGGTPTTAQNSSVDDLPSKSASPANSVIQSRFAENLKRLTRYDKFGISGFSVSATTRSPQLSATLAQKMAEQAQMLIIRRDLRQLEEGKNYIVNKLDELSDSLGEIETEMLAVRKKSGSEVSKRTGPYQELTDLRGIKSDLEENKIKLEQNEKLIGSITKNLKQQRRQITSNSLDFPTLTIIKRQLAALQARKKGLIAEGMAENSPQVLSLDEEIEKTQLQLPKNYQLDQSVGKDESIEFIEDNINPELRLSTLRKENWLLKARINAASKLILADKISKESLPQDEQKYYALNKKLEMKYILYGELSKQLFNIDVSRISIQNRITQIETPKASYAVRDPSLFPLVPMTFILALVFATFLATIIEHFDPVIVSTKDFPGFNFITLGSLPLLNDSTSSKKNKKGDLNTTLIFRHRLELPQTVPFKRVRTRLLQLEKNLPYKPQVISIHSTHSGDGKSFVTGNLGASMATIPNKRVLMIDADLRRKAISREFTTKNDKGLSDLLSDANLKSIEPFIIKNIQPNLDLLPCGPAVSTSSELLNTPKFSELLNQARALYDFIIIDTAPFLALPDSEAVASHSDVIVIVSSSNKTKVNDLATMLDHFLQFDDKPVCMLLNRSNSKTQLYYNYGSPKDELARNKAA